jgi:hypothetical protein
MILRTQQAPSDQGVFRMILHTSARRRANTLAAAFVLAATPAALAAPSLAAGKTANVRCLGGGSKCTAVVGLAGGASNKKLRITLSDTNLKLVGVVAKPSSVRGAYLLSHGKFSLGGSVFTVTLNAVKAIGKGATLTLKFSSHGNAVRLSG